MQSSARRVTHYAILGVAADAPKNMIRKSYLALAKKYHPDGSHGDSEKFKQGIYCILDNNC
jgi:DnaJ-class molecular chaperone